MMFGILGLHDVRSSPGGGRGAGRRLTLAILKAELEMGWKAKVGIREGLAMTLNWFQETLGKV